MNVNFSSYYGNSTSGHHFLVETELGGGYQFVEILITEAEMSRILLFYENSVCNSEPVAFSIGNFVILFKRDQLKALSKVIK
jgi:hypothetical protein